MTQKITGEAPFQVLATNFSISPSQQNYVLQISADGTNYSDLFTVSAGQTKMVTNVANGSFYRMKNNNSEVTINWRTQCNDGQGGGGGGSYILPPATEQTLGGIKVGSGLTVQADGTLSANGGGGIDYNEDLADYGNFITSDESIPIGFVIPIGDDGQGQTTDYAGLKYEPGQASIAEFHLNDEDPSNPYWEQTLSNNLVTEGQLEELVPYAIELSTNNPDDFTEEDIVALNEFFDAVEADPSIAKDAYVQIGSDLYRCSLAEYDSGLGDFSFVLVYSDLIDEIDLQFEDGSYSEGNHSRWNGNTILKAVSEAPETLEKGDVYALNKPFVAPESPDGQTVYGGNITDFKAAVEDNNNQIWVNTWDDTGHTETTNQGYFELDKNGDLAFYDYQGDYYYILMDYYDRKGEWIQCNGVYIRWEGENLYFYVNQESNGVYFNPDVDMNFDSVGSTIGVYQANFKTLPNVKIEVDGDAHIDGTAEAPEQVVTNSIGHMLVSFNDPSAATGKVCALGSWDNRYNLTYDYSNDRWTLYDSDGENVLVEVGDGQSRSAQFDGSPTVYLSYSGGVLTANTSEDKGWIEWEMGDGGTVLDPEELAKVSQIPAENRLVPTGGGYGQYLWTDGTNTSWNNAPSPEQYWGYPYEDGTAPVYSTSTWSTQWRKVVQSQDVKNIVKITVSDYEDLVANDETDPNTLYLTYEPQL